jgi:glycosyltransferase involved in cell wall biosynthesis
MNFLVSVIVPVYNVEEYLARCINSIIVQTYTHLEIILVDDGSFDNSPAICNDFAHKDQRITVIHKSNGGLSSARNIGIDIAKGDFIGFVDSDDFVENDMFEKLLEGCIKNDSYVSMCGRYNYFNEGSKVSVFTLSKQEIWTDRQTIHNLLLWNNIDSSSCDKLFHKDLFKNTRFPIGTLSEDVAIVPHILSKTHSLVHIGSAKYYYNYRHGSISRSGFSREQMNVLTVHKETADFLKNKYPELSNQADSFYLKVFLKVYHDFYSQNNEITGSNCKQEIEDLARSQFRSILTNRYIHIRVKIIFLLIFFKIFKYFKKISVFTAHSCY